MHFFDVRVTNTSSPSQQQLSLAQIYKRHEQEKKRLYNDRVMNIEHGFFTPLVYSVHGGMSPECLKYHKHLADKIAAKTNQKCDRVVTWIRCKLSFVVLRSTLLCLRGSRGIGNCTNLTEDFEIACDVARL